MIVYLIIFYCARLTLVLTIFNNHFFNLISELDSRSLEIM
jgi:hypothetical protein